MQHVRSLAHGIGPRPATTAAEREAHAYCQRTLRDLGLAVQVQEFGSVSTFSWPWLVTGSLLLGAAATIWGPGSLRLLALVLAVLGAICFWGLMTGRIEVGRLFPQRPSRNVVGIVPARGKAAQRVVLVAHVDSTRAALLFAPGQVRNFGLSFALNAILALWLLVAAVGNAFFPALAPWPWLVLPPAAGLLYGVLVLVHRELCCRWVQGANDNAAGVAVTLALAERYSRQPLARTELWCVFSGCEEVGAPTGMLRFLERYRHDLRTATILVVDNVGAGDPRYLLGEGALPFHRADADLLRLAADVAQDNQALRAAPGRVPLGVYTDAGPALAAGYRTLAVWSERDGVLPNWHWPTDVLENVEPPALDRAMTFLSGLLERIDQGAAAS